MGYPMNKRFNKRDNSRAEEKAIDTEQVINYLNHAFSSTTRPLGLNNSSGTQLREYQVEFCYLINEIQRGPKYIIPKIIQDANDLINNIKQQVDAQQKNH